MAAIRTAYGPRYGQVHGLRALHCSRPMRRVPCARLPILTLPLPRCYGGANSRRTWQYRLRAKAAHLPPNVVGRNGAAVSPEARNPYSDTLQARVRCAGISPQRMAHPRDVTLPHPFLDRMGGRGDAAAYRTSTFLSYRQDQRASVSRCPSLPAPLRSGLLKLRGGKRSDGVVAPFDSPARCAGLSWHGPQSVQRRGAPLGDRNSDRLPGRGLRSA